MDEPEKSSKKTMLSFRPKGETLFFQHLVKPLPAKRGIRGDSGGLLTDPSKLKNFPGI